MLPLRRLRVGHTQTVIVSGEPLDKGQEWAESPGTWFDPEDYGGLDDTYPSAKAIVELLIQVVGPSSVVDVGCGPGIFVAEWLRRGLDDVVGMDGPPVSAVYRAPASSFRVVDLAQPVESDRRFDLATCLEVAEHLLPADERVLVSSLVSLAPIVAFSAAPPGQGGLGHVNEQWPLHWSRLFAEHRYQQVDVIRGQLVDSEDVDWYYRTNLVVFAADDQVVQILERADCLEIPDAYQLAFQSGIRSGLTERSWSELVKAMVWKIRRRLGTTRLGAAVRRCLPGA